MVKRRLGLHRVAVGLIFFFRRQMLDFVDVGMFRVDVDYEHVRPRVDFAMLDSLECVFGTNMFSGFYDTHVYHMYLITRPGYSPSYVMRLPANISTLNLPNVSSSVQWLTFCTGDGGAPTAVLAITFETTAAEVEVHARMAEVVQWLERMSAYSDVLRLDHAAPNVLSVLCCKDTPLLQAPHLMDSNGLPNWRLPLSSFHADETFLFQADIAHSTGVALDLTLQVPPDVQHVFANLHVHALHSLFQCVERTHLEKRPLTHPPVEARDDTLAVEDVVVYLSADGQSLVYARVVGLDVALPYWVQLDNAEQPQCFAKFNVADQVLGSPLQVLQSFIPS